METVLLYITHQELAERKWTRNKSLDVLKTCLKPFVSFILTSSLVERV